MTVISKNRWGWKGGTQRFFRSSSGTASSPMVSYFRFTAFTPAKCSREYNSVEAWPAERMNLSRFGQIGSSGSKSQKLLPQHVYNRCHGHGSSWMTGVRLLDGIHAESPGCIYREGVDVRHTPKVRLVAGGNK